MLSATHTAASGPLRPAARRMLSVAALIGSVAACADSAPGDDSSLAWHQRLASPDGEERSQAIEEAMLTPEVDRATALQQLLRTDPEPRLREQAVLAYSQVAGRDSVATLRESALADSDPAVVSAALASLDRIAEAYPQPARGFLVVAWPQAFVAGELLDIHVRFGSRQDAPRAQVELRLPPELELVSPREPRWRGAVKADAPEELVFRARATGRASRGGATVHLKLDYPEMLDVELFDDRRPVQFDGRAGAFLAPPPATRRAP
jgi:hypothetical protein